MASNCRLKPQAAQICWHAHIPLTVALAALLGPDAPANTIGRLKAAWWDEYEAWRRRDLSARRSVYFWADGVYFSPRMDHDKQCVLVIIGADEIGATFTGVPYVDACTINPSPM